MGVWIEIYYISSNSFFCHRHSLHGSVDWNFIWWISRRAVKRHSLHGSVDWNNMSVLVLNRIYVTPCMGVWIEIGILPSFILWWWSHSLHGSVDWNYLWSYTFLHRQQCHSLHGSVDWNSFYIKIKKGGSCHSLRGNGIEIYLSLCGYLVVLSIFMKMVIY